MKQIRAWIALATLLAFTGFTTATALHTHSVTKDPSSCSICKIAHQTPALIGEAVSASRTVEITEATPAVALSATLQVVYTSHGLSPPTL